MAEQHISDDEFIERFAPEMDEGGSYRQYVEWDDPVERAVLLRANQERRLWTAVDGEELVITNGMQYVNRLFYVITAIPYLEDAVIDVY